MTLFDRIKETAKSRGYSIAEVERKAGVSTNYMYQWKTRNPNPETLGSVAKVLGVSVDYLLGNDELQDKKSTSTPDHIDVEDIVDNAAMLTSRNHALSDEDRSAIKAMLTGYLNSKEGQRCLKKYGGYGDKNVGENGDD